MTPAFAILASVASVAALWPLVGRRSSPRSPASSTAFVAFALWTVYGALLDSSALVAASAIGLVFTSLVLSARALFGDAPLPRASRARSPRRSPKLEPRPHATLQTA